MRFPAVKISGPLALDAGNIRRSETRLPVAKLAGLVIVALFPAVFWTGVIALLSPLFGVQLSFAVLATIAGGSSIFLAAIYAALSASSERS